MENLSFASKNYAIEVKMFEVFSFLLHLNIDENREILMIIKHQFFFIDR